MLDIKKLKILIIDDHFLARQTVKDSLRDLGIIDVTGANDGAAGADALRRAHEMKQPYDVVFVDRNMPQIEGLDLLKHFRAIPDYDNVAFIMFTAASERVDVLKAINSGATGYLIKPVSKKAINNKLMEIAVWLDEQKKDAST